MLKGVITEVEHLKKYNATRLTINSKHLVYIKQLVEYLQGVPVQAHGEWKNSPKGRYFLASSLNVVKDKTKGNSIYSAIGAMTDKEIKKADELSQIISLLVKIGQKKNARKVLKVRNTSSELINNPHILALKNTINFKTAEFLHNSLYCPNTIERVESAIAEVLDIAYKSGKPCLAEQELITKVCDILKTRDGIAEMVKSARSSVVVKDGNLYYIPKIHYFKTQTLKTMSSQNVPSLTDEALLSNRFTAVIGGAGTGKTTLIKSLKQLHNNIVCALTGKASQLISADTPTLHKLLGYGKGGFSVRHIDCYMLIVDEASMMDWYIAYHLFCVLKGPQHIILSGDPQQLPPIHGGSAFKEILEVMHEDAIVRLEKAYRFLNGKNNIITIRKENTSDIINAVLALSISLKREKTNFQIITPVKSNIIGTFKLNQILQSRLNPHGKVLVEDLRAGDKVIVTKNCYDKEFEVKNGMIGTLMDAEDNKFYIHVHDIDRTLDFMRSEFELAYALTVHKAQGSQWDYVIFVDVEKIYPDFVTAELKHTGLTRGRIETYHITL